MIIIAELSSSKDPNHISKAAATEVLYPLLAKLKTEVSLRDAENWFNVVSNGDDERKIGIQRIAAHLKQINFCETSEFWIDFEREAQIFLS